MYTILIKPNDKKTQYQALKPLSAIETPIWLACLADKYDNPRIIDAEAENLSFPEINNRIPLEPVEIIILATGNHPSAHVQQKNVADRLDNYLLRSGRKNIKVYDYLMFDPTETSPRYDMLNMKKYRAHNWQTWGKKDKSYASVFSSISCPFTCDFCCIKDFYRSKYKIRKPMFVVSDILNLYHKYEITNFKMMDELFAMNTKHVNDICDLLIKNEIGEKINIWAYARVDTLGSDLARPTLLKKLRKAGFKWLGYGIESGNEKIREKNKRGFLSNKEIKNVVKMTKDAGINVAANYMFGFKEDNAYTMNETSEFAIMLNTEYANFYCVAPYPGTCLKDNIKRSPEQFAQLSYEFIPMETDHASPAYVLNIRDKSFQEYFTNSIYLSMMKKKFGKEAIKEIKGMTKIKLRRRILGD